MPSTGRVSDERVHMGGIDSEHTCDALLINVIGMSRCIDGERSTCYNGEDISRPFR
jgi:hypothetical protein